MALDALQRMMAALFRPLWEGCTAPLIYHLCASAVDLMLELDYVVARIESSLAMFNDALHRPTPMGERIPTNVEMFGIFKDLVGVATLALLDVAPS